MTARIKTRLKDAVVIEVTLPLNRSMLEGETDIELALNEAGTLANDELLKRLDADGITKSTSKRHVEKS